MPECPLLLRKKKGPLIRPTQWTASEKAPSLISFFPNRTLSYL